MFRLWWALLSWLQIGRLRVVCAWCGLVLCSGRQPTSHGICQPCLKVQRVVWGMDEADGADVAVTK